jgi:trigger factor
VKTSVERIDDTTVKLNVTVEAARVDAALDEAARELAAQVKIPGFRPGRVPRRVLENRIGRETLVAEALRDALPAFFADAVQEAELPVVGNPSFDLGTFEAGRDAEFTATVEVRPDIAVPDYAGLQVPHPEWEVTDDEVDAQLDALRDRFAELETVSRPARVGDYVVVTISGEQHGRRFEEASGEDLLYEIGDVEQSGSALDRNLVGASAGAILKFNDTLGADYGELAGQELAFTAIVKEVKIKQLPDLDDEFALTASEFDTIDELRESLRTQMADAKLGYARAALRGAVVEQVSDLVDVSLPRSLVDAEVNYRLHDLAHQAEQRNLPIEQFLQAAGMTPQELTERIEEEARRTVKAQLVVDAIGRDARVQISEADLGAEIAAQAGRLGRPPEEVARFLTQPENLSGLVSDVFRRKAIDHLLGAVQVLGGPPAHAEPEAVGDEERATE